MRRRYLSLTQAPSAPPAPVMEMMTKYSELRQVAENLETRSGQELLFSFAGGFLSVIVGLAGVRAFHAARCAIPLVGAHRRTANDIYETAAEGLRVELGEFSAVETPLVGGA